MSNTRSQKPEARSRKMPASIFNDPGYWIGRIAEAAGQGDQQVSGTGALTGVPDLNAPYDALKRLERIRGLLSGYLSHQSLLTSAELLAVRNQSGLNRKEILAALASGPRQTVRRRK